MSQPVFDADNHFYETRDCFSRYIEPKFRDKAVHARDNPDGSHDIFIGDEDDRREGPRE